MDDNRILSERIREVPPFHPPVRPVPTPETIIFDGGLPDPVTHPITDIAELTAAIVAGNEPKIMGYTYEMGDIPLREQIAARHGGGLTADSIVLTNGCAGAIALTALALLEPGDVVITETLSWGGALKAFRQMGAEIVAVPMDAGGLDTHVLADTLERLRREGRRVKLLYTISTCHNPAGVSLSAERRKKVLRLLEPHGTLVVQDDTYGELSYSEPPPSFLSLAPERAIHMGSFSKTIAPGIRVGWIATNARLAEALGRARVDLGNSPIFQRFVARFIADGRYDQHLAEIRPFYRRKRDVMLGLLDRHCAGLGEWTRPEGGFFIWMKLACGDAAKALDAARKENVSFLPGSQFSAAEPHADHLRLGYGILNEGRFEEGIIRLGRALSQAANEPA